MLRKLKRQIPGEPLAARYNWCHGQVPGRGPAVEKHCSRQPYFSVIRGRMNDGPAQMCLRKGKLWFNEPSNYQMTSSVKQCTYGRSTEVLLNNHCCLEKKGNNYYIFWVRVCSLTYPTRNAHAPCYTVFFVACPSIPILPHYLINCTIFGKKMLWNTKCVCWFPLQLWPEKCFHSKEKWARYDQKCILDFM